MIRVQECFRIWGLEIRINKTSFGVPSLPSRFFLVLGCGRNNILISLCPQCLCGRKNQSNQWKSASKKGFGLWVGFSTDDS